MQRLARIVPFSLSSLVMLGGGVVAQRTSRVSLDSSGAQATGSSQHPSISADGRFVAFASWASDLVAGDTNGTWDVFVHDRQSGTTERVSVASGGAEGNAGSGSPAISADGRFVVFASGASNLVAGDTNNTADIFVRDRQSGTTERVSVATGGVEGNSNSEYPSISADGRFVAFGSYASNLVAGDTNGFEDVFVHDRQSGTTRRVSLDSAGAQGSSSSGGWGISISADGRFVAFASWASNLVAGDTNSSYDIFMRDRQSGTTERVSVDSGGVQAYGHSFYPSISADGRFAAFESWAPNLVAGDTNGTWDVFVHDRQSGTTERVSVSTAGGQGYLESHSPSISVDGRFVAFDSWTPDLVAGDTNGAYDIFMRDRQSGTTERVSVATGGAQGDGASRDPTISADGSFVAFDSGATDLVAGDTNGTADVFLSDRTCSGIYIYCTAKPNSLGCVPLIGSVGLPSQSGTDNFYVTASNVLNNKLGMMLWSLAPASNPFFGGTLCLHSPIVRTPAQMSGGSPTGSDCSGSYAYHFTQAYMLQQLLAANTTVYAQFWSRDPGFAPPNSIGLTNGLSFTICP
jgi:Tol biopolymer transport system component